MATLETTSKAFLIDLSDTAGTAQAPTTVQGMIDLFGGGKAGVSALARELADVRGIKYASARRNIERYITEKGTERRNPKRLMADLEKVADAQANKQNTRRILERAADGVEIAFAGDVRISDDERPREFTVTLSADDLAPFLEDAMGHHWQAAADQLNYAVLNAWDMGRGLIVGSGGSITGVDDWDFHYITDEQ